MESTPQNIWSQTLYDARSNSYDDSWHPQFAAHLVSLAGLQPGQRVLDLAAGTGLASYAAAERVAPHGRVLALDVSAGMLRAAAAKKPAFARRMRERHGAAANDDLLVFERADVTRLHALPALDGREGTFDAVTAASALVLLSEPRRAVAGWARYVARGGLLVVDVPHEHNQRHLALMERAARRVGLPLAFHRAWVTGRAAFVEVLEGTGEFDVVRVEFVEQTGEGRRFFGVAEWEAFFERALGPVGVATEEERARLRAAFEEEWVAAADAQGRVEDVDGVYVAVARRR